MNPQVAAIPPSTITGFLCVDLSYSFGLVQKRFSDRKLSIHSQRESVTHEETPTSRQTDANIDPGIKGINLTTSITKHQHSLNYFLTIIKSRDFKNNPKVTFTNKSNVGKHKCRCSTLQKQGGEKTSSETWHPLSPY